MRYGKPAILLAMAVAGGAAMAQTGQDGGAIKADSPFGRITLSTLPFNPDLSIISATYTPSGKILVAYREKGSRDERDVRLAVVDEDGKHLRPVFAGVIPVREKDNGLRYMVFSDNRRVFLGDFIIECAKSLDDCGKSTLIPVDYPAEVASGDHISHRWSEMVVAPDNRDVAWTSLLSNYSAMVFVGTLEKAGDRYRLVEPRIVSTLDPFAKDPRHADGVVPQPVRGGEVKQFVHGGTALSLVGAIRRDLPDSVVQHLATGKRDAITDTPGYTETTIFSPDERLGMTMTTRFSQHSDPAILGLLPRPYPDSLNMGLSMFAYTYAVTGVRRDRPGNIGPALIDIQASGTQDHYLGVNLGTDPAWVFHSPMSWHPDSRSALWMEGQRGGGAMRIRIAHLSDYRPAKAVAPQPVPTNIAYALSDMSAVKAYAASSQNQDVKVYGRKSGYLTYRRTPEGLIEKRYVDFSDDGRNVYSGQERMEANPRGRSTYVAQVNLTGPKPGKMDVKITFGPLGGKQPAQIVFDKDEAGSPLTRGYADYDGQRLKAEDLVP